VETTTVIENSLGMKLAWIPPGDFLMGSPDTERGRLRHEDLHAVRITAPFYLGVYEVTQAEYQRVMGRNPSHFQRVAGHDAARFPVENVSWTEAEEFCSRLSSLPKEQESQRVYRLPTEAEWEYACRAGTATPYHFGSRLTGREANCNGSLPYGTRSQGIFLRRPTTVGSYEPNAFGLFDMHGNVSEWCQDWYALEYYEDSPSEDPQGPAQTAYRVSRGGDWRSYPFVCRSAHRYGAIPTRTSNNRGFRVAAGFPHSEIVPMTAIAGS